MNIFIRQQTISARLVAGVAITALLLGAFPASFFVAEAAGDEIGVSPDGGFEGGFDGDTSSATSTISGYKWNDVNGDGDWDRETEAGIPNWEIKVSDGDADPQYDRTDENGFYSFTVTNGSYQVSETGQKGWEQTGTVGENVDDGICFVNVTEGNSTCDFGNREITVPITVCKNVSDERTDSTTPVAGWTVYLSTTSPDTVIAVSPDADYGPAYTLVTGPNGCVTQNVDPADGPWYAFEDMRAGWYQDDIDVLGGETNWGEFSDGGYCSFFAEERSSRPEEKSRVSDSDSEYACNFYNVDARKAVTGYKWSDVNSDGIKNDGEVGVAGWTITATDKQESPLTSVSVVTDSNGYYTLLLPVEGFWAISEESRPNWTQTAVYENGSRLTLESEEGESISECTLSLRSKYLTRERLDGISVPVINNRCDFLNHETPRRSGGGGSSGTRVKDRTPAPTGAVLGAATSTPQCSVYLNEYMREGKAASSTEITKLQVFLNAVGIKLEITGVFDKATDAAVKAFQAQHKAEVLTPWYLAKVVPHENPTGWVYQLTRWKINNIVCPGSEVYPSLDKS